MEKKEIIFGQFLLKNNVITKEDLEYIEIYHPPVIRTALWGLKLDLADLFIHAGILRKKGWFKRIRFTPENPEEFVAMVKETFEM